jgi:lactose/L-arabinose transport system substrate-binding protein
MQLPTSKSRLFTITAATLCLVALAVVGCGNGPNDNSSTALTSLSSNSDLSQTHADITVWSWNIAAKSLNQLLPAFNQTTPNVKVTVLQTQARMQTRLMLSLAAGVGAPDVSQLQATDAPHYMATHQLLDLTSVAERYKSQFPPSIWNGCTDDGRVYAIPWDMGPCAVFYKRDIFKKYGIDPSKIQTWDDYIAAGKQIVQKSSGRTKMLPLGPTELEAFFEVFIQKTGGQIFNENGDIAIDSPQSQQALDLIKRLRRSGICSDVPAYGQEWLAGFGDDSIASYPGAFWLSGTIKDTVGVTSNQAGRWGVFRLPATAAGGLHVANWGGSVLVIPASGKNLAASWAFVRYALCTKDGQLAQYRSNNLFPTLRSAQDASDLDDPDPFFAGQKVGRLFATGSSLIQPLYRTGNWAEATNYVEQDLSHWSASGMNDDQLFANLAQEMHKRLGNPIAGGVQ